MITRYLTRLAFIRLASLGLPEKIFTRRPKVADDVGSHESGVHGEDKPVSE